mmetsp:Transcript_42297/g.130436  ORF Transcript_42297/g.130436 Transcript_42297/m.130436 type:complete len:686 (+) Transcript_42297:1095-3152(+)
MARGRALDGGRAPRDVSRLLRPLGVGGRPRLAGDAAERGRPPPRRRARRRAVAAVGVGRLVWLVRLDTVGGRGSARALRRDAAARRPARLAPAARTAVPDGCRRASEGAAGDAGAVCRRLRGGALPARPGVGRGRRQAAAERARVARVPRRVADCGRVRGAPLLEPRRPRGELPRVVGPRLSVGAGAAPAGGQPAAGRLLPRAAPALLLRRGGAAGGEAALARAARAAPHRRRAGAVLRDCLAPAADARADGGHGAGAHPLPLRPLHLPRPRKDGDGGGRGDDARPAAPGRRGGAAQGVPALAQPAAAPAPPQLPLRRGRARLRGGARERAGQRRGSAQLGERRAVKHRLGAAAAQGARPRQHLRARRHAGAGHRRLVPRAAAAAAVQAPPLGRAARQPARPLPAPGHRRDGRVLRAAQRDHARARRVRAGRAARRQLARQQPDLRALGLGREVHRHAGQGARRAVDGPRLSRPEGVVGAGAAARRTAQHRGGAAADGRVCLWRAAQRRGGRDPEAAAGRAERRLRGLLQGRGAGRRRARRQAGGRSRGRHHRRRRGPQEPDDGAARPDSPPPPAAHVWAVGRAAPLLKRRRAHPARPARRGDGARRPLPRVGALLQPGALREPAAGGDLARRHDRARHPALGQRGGRRGQQQQRGRRRRRPRDRARLVGAAQPDCRVGVRGAVP